MEDKIKKYLKENLKLSWDYRDGKYYLVLTVGEEKITEVCFGEGY